MTSADNYVQERGYWTLCENLLRHLMNCSCISWW